MFRSSCRGLASRLVPLGIAAAMSLPTGIAPPTPVAAQTPDAPRADDRSPVAGSPSSLAPIDAPSTRRTDVSDDYHGTVVPDPYRWLENPDAPETMAWVDSQNVVTERFLAGVEQRETIRKRLESLWNFERYALPVRRGDRLFYEHNDGLSNQDRLYVIEDSGEPRLLFDPNALAADGTVDLADWEPSDDGRYLAMAFAAAGSDWRDWRVMEVSTGEMTSDLVRWSKFAGATWAADGSGFWYSRFDAPAEGQEFTGSNYFHQVWFHRIGTDQSADTKVYDRADEKDWMFDPLVTEDGRYLTLTVSKGTLSQNQFFYRDLDDPTGAMVELLAGFDAEYLFVGNRGRTFYFLTDHQAPLRRLIAIDLDRPDVERWVEVVPQSDVVALAATFVGDRFLLSYLEDARSVVRIHARDGAAVTEVALPGIGAVAGFEGRSDRSETYYSFQGFTMPPTIFRYDTATGESQPFREIRVGFDPDRFETRQIFAVSRDGTRVPIFVVARKGTPLDGRRPTLLYGYGGFDISITPRFSVANLAWVDMGGVYAVANLRGGGEYGREWHEAGMLDRKQNVFDDFIASAEHLIELGYTSPAHLGIYGRSNGGLLVGAAMTQRPELFAAAVPAVGVMDMLRFQKFTIGHAWVSEYGSSDDPDQFRTLFAYSPLHNLRPGIRYPATMVMTADHDDRVVPAHSHKFAAQLQACQAKDGPPCIIRIETSGGHGAGKPVSMQIAEATDLLAFLAAGTGLESQ